MNTELRKLIMGLAGALVLVASLVLNVAPAVAQPADDDSRGRSATFPPSGPPQTRTGATSSDITCTRSDVDKSWVTWCRRLPNDGDKGGVSGFANVHNERVEGLYADLEFEALGEKIILRADSGDTTHFGLYVWRGSRWETAFVHTDDDGKIRKELSLSIPDGRPVYVGVCVESWNQDECAGNGTLRA